MASNIPGFLLRMPPALKEAMEVQAAAAMRSLNQEVCFRLLASLGEQPVDRVPVALLDVPAPRVAPKVAGTRKRKAKSARRAVRRGK